MPDSYGRPLCSSPRLRCEISHAMPIVRKTNETPAKANPTTYQMPVNPTPFRATRPGWRRWSRGPVERAAVPGIGWAVLVGILARERGWWRLHDGRADRPSERVVRVVGDRGHVGERRAPSARASSRATPRQVVPDRLESCGGAVTCGNRYIAVFRSGLVGCGEVARGPSVRGGIRTRARPVRPRASRARRPSPGSGPSRSGRAGGTARSGPRGTTRASSPGRPGSPGAAPPSRGRPGTRPGSWSRDGRGRPRSAARSTAVTSTWAVRSWRPTCRYGSSWTRWRRYARSVPSRRRTGSYSSVAG